MSHAFESHPSMQVLMAFAEGLGLEGDTPGLEEHLVNCEVCAAALAKFDVRGGLVRQIRSAFVRTDSATEQGGDTIPGCNDAITLTSLRGFLQSPTRAGSLGRLGHYEILEIAGRGTFGVVFRAFDDVLERIVAIKLLTPDLAANRDARQRFLREARAAAAIRHPNVVQIHSVCEQPLPFLAMEFIPGENLQQRLDRLGCLPPAEVVRIGRQIAAGLHAAHSRGLVHRDIKPGNILLDATDELCAKITDFGLVRRTEDDSISQSGLVAGTPLYMSPEQVKGHELDHRSDLFSLGTVLYALLSGQSPFRAGSTLGVATAIRDDIPRPLAEIVSQAPPALCAIIARLHSKPPADRFQSAKEVGEALGQCGSTVSTINLPTMSGSVPVTASSSVSSERPATSTARGRAANDRTVRRRVPLAMALAGLVATAVIVIRTNNSEFTVQTDSPAVAARLHPHDGIIVVDRKTRQAFHLKLGPNRLPNGDHDLSIETPDGLEFDTPQFTLKRFGSAIAKIRARQLDDAPATVTTTPPNKSMDRPGVTEPTPAQILDAHRKLALYLIAQGATFHGVNDANGQNVNLVSKLEDVPSGPFRVTEIELPSATDAQIKEVVDLAVEFVPIETLYLNGNHKSEQISAVGLKELVRLKSLRSVGLRSATGFPASDLQVLSGMPQLRMLNVGDLPIGDAVIQQLQHLPHINSLWLNDCEVTEDGLLPLRNSSIEQLYINSPHLSDRICEILADIKGLKDLRLINCRGFTGASLDKLRHLPLSEIHLGMTGMRESALPVLSQFPQLTELVFHNNNLTDAALPALAGLPLKSLGLHEPKMTQTAIQQLHESMPQARIASNFGTLEPDPRLPARKAAEWIIEQGWVFEARLDETGDIVFPIKTRDAMPTAPFHFQSVALTGVTEQRVKHLIELTAGKVAVHEISMVGHEQTDLLPGDIVADLLRLPELQSLSIGHTRLTRPNIALLQKFANLTHLEISNVELPADALIDLRRCQKLRRLGLNDPGLGDAGLQPLRDISGLQELYLNDPQITDSFWDSLRHLNRLTDLHLLGSASLTCEGIEQLRDLPLESLAIRNTGLRDATLRHLAAFKHLKSLELSSNAESDGALEYIGKIAGLTALNLDDTRIGNDKLHELRSLSKLASLSLARTNVDDSGLETIAQIPTLVRLKLSDLPLTDAGLLHLAKLQRLVNLRLERTKVTAAGIQSLQTALPACEIVWDRN